MQDADAWTISNNRAEFTNKTTMEQTEVSVDLCQYATLTGQDPPWSGSYTDVRDATACDTPGGTEWDRVGPGYIVAWCPTSTEDNDHLRSLHIPPFPYLSRILHRKGMNPAKGFAWDSSSLGNLAPMLFENCLSLRHSKCYGIEDGRSFIAFCNSLINARTSNDHT